MNTRTPILAAAALLIALAPAAEALSPPVNDKLFLSIVGRPVSILPVRPPAANPPFAWPIWPPVAKPLPVLPPFVWPTPRPVPPTVRPFPLPVLPPFVKPLPPPVFKPLPVPQPIVKPVPQPIITPLPVPQTSARPVPPPQPKPLPVVQPAPPRPTPVTSIINPGGGYSSAIITIRKK